MLFAKIITISFSDFVAFNKVYLGAWFRIRSVWIWGMVTVLAVLMFVIGLSSDAEVRARSIPFIIFLFIFIYILFAAGIWLLWWIVKGLFRLLLYAGYKSKTDVFMNVQVMINERGIEYRTRRGNYASLWPQIVKIDDDGLRYFIYYASNAVFILPKRYFSSLDELAQFANFLKAYTNPDLKYNEK